MKISIIEDEDQARRSLKKLISLVHPKAKVVYESSRVKDAILYLKTHSVDLVFLDIELEDGNGFELLNAFLKSDFKVIITTAFDDKAIDAYRSNAMDYLLKPISPYDLKSALKRVIKQLKIEALANKAAEEKLTLKTNKAFIRLAPSEIIRLKADGAYTHFITKDSDILVSKNLQYYQNLLGDCFLRVHQSHLVRQDQISAIKGKEVFLINGDVVPLSNRRKQLVFKLLE